MTIFLLSLAVILLAILGLGVGVLMGRRPLTGSCGGDVAVRNCLVCPGREEDA